MLLIKPEYTAGILGAKMEKNHERMFTKVKK